MQLMPRLIFIEIMRPGQLPMMVCGLHKVLFIYYVSKFWGFFLPPTPPTPLGKLIFLVLKLLLPFSNPPSPPTNAYVIYECPQQAGHPHMNSFIPNNEISEPSGLSSITGWFSIDFYCFPFLPNCGIEKRLIKESYNADQVISFSITF
jgi:hypothetical protein